MRTPFQYLIKLFLFTMITSTAFAEGIRPDSFTFSGVVGGYTFDGRQHLETRPLVGVRGGYNFTSYLGVELLFDYARTEGTRGPGDANMFRYGGDLLFYLFPDHALVPYLAAGYSGITLDQERQRTNNLGVFDYGPGIRYFLNDDLALRGDFRHLVFRDGRTLSNYEYTVGITYQFGGNQTAARPIATPPASETSPRPETGAAPPKVSKPEPITPEPEQAQPKEAPLEPVPTTEPTPGTYKYCVPLHIEFDIDKAEIRPEYYDEVARAGDFMKKYPTTSAVIEGYCDQVGSDEYNLQLSQQRAEAVVAYLEKRFGIDSSRLTAKGYGKAKTITDNVSDEAKQKNRRIEAVIDCAFDVKEIKESERICTGLKLEFDTGRAEIKPEYHNELARVADYLKRYPSTTALIEGHTDNIGGFDFNMALSKHRAENVVSYLVEKFGIKRSRLAARGYGFTRRIAYNNTPEGRQKNRRINAVIDCVVKTR
ncbi:MAG TPA: outer membrane beta-barrel domain-containing protein [Desulfuromonadaceae bacterium]|jgi:OOP family OmpA-OmpF porin